MSKRKYPLRGIFYGIWSILLIFCVFLLVNSYLKEVHMISHSARLEILEDSFDFHPNFNQINIENTDPEVLYIYLVDLDGTLANSYERYPALALTEFEFPENDIAFIRYREEKEDQEILLLKKILRRGREDVSKQALFLGMDYTKYKMHEYQAFLKYTLILFSLLGLVILSIFSWRRWLRGQAEIQANERFIYTGKLSRQIAHEIKNPLGVMQATVDYLRELDDPEMMKEELEDIRHEIGRLNRLVERIRSFTKEENLELTEIELGSFLRNLGERMQRRYPGLVSSITDDAEKLFILGDPDQMTQVLINLIQNADESYPDEKTADRMILLGLRYDRENVEIFIQDWGRKIPPVLMDKLFDPFVTNKAQGSGLGLAICRQIMEKHQGKITVETSEETKRFTLHLPIHQIVE